MKNQMICYLSQMTVEFFLLVLSFVAAVAIENVPFSLGVLRFFVEEQFVDFFLQMMNEKGRLVCYVQLHDCFAL